MRSGRKIWAVLAAASVAVLVIASTSIAFGDTLNVDSLSIPPQTIDLALANGSGSGAALLEVDCSGQAHAAPGAMSFTMSITSIGAAGDPSELTVTPSLTIPASWPADGTGCGDSGLSAAGTLSVSASVAANAASGDRKFRIDLQSTDADVNNPTQTFVTYSFTGSGGGGGGPTNNPPSIGADNASVQVDEGSTASNTGTWSDLDSADNVTLSASVGSVGQSGTNSGGTWSWSYQTTDGPDESQTVTITADDGHATTSTTFPLTVDNVAPTTTMQSGPGTVSEDSSGSVAYTFSISDPGNDTWTTATSCGANGIKQSEDATSVTCRFPDGGNPSSATSVTATSTDSDQETGNTASTSVTINNVAPSINGFSVTGASAVACLGGNQVTVGFSVSDPADQTYDAISGSISWGDNSSTPVSGRSVSESHTYSAGSYTLSVSVNDGDGGIANAGGANGGSVSLLYATSGILQPINGTGPRSSFKLGSTIPVKIKITDCAGSPVGTLGPQVHLAKIDNSADSVNELISSSAADSGTTMRFTGAPDNQYIFNLSTKRSQFNAGQDLTPGTYHVWITDPAIAQVDAYIDIKK